jgi:selenocysteine lyase/cysteine desulfurase
VGFDIAGQTAEESAARLLEKNVIASASPYRRQVVRLSASLVNDEAEVERALVAVRTVAAQ